MKKLLIMIGLIGSVYGSDVSISDWSSLISYCTEEPNITETICGNSVTFDNVYTLKQDFTNYTLNVGTDINMPASTKLVIPSGITLNLTNSGSYKNYYMSNNSAIEINGILNKGCYKLYGPNEEGTENSYTNAYIIVNGELNQNEGNCIGTIKRYSRLNINGSGTINNKKYIQPNSNSSILFSGTGNISNTGSISTWVSNSSITFSNTGEITNAGEIYSIDNSSITISKGTTIRNKGGSIYMPSSTTANTSLILDGTLIFEKGEGEEGKYPGFNTECMVMEEDEHMQDMIEAGMPEEEILRMFDRNGDGKIENYSTYIVISGSGTIDMSSLRDADMTLEDHYSLSTTQGCINIPSASFSTTTPFTGTIKLPYNTTCKNLDLSNATSISQLYYDGKLLDKGTLWVNTAGRIMKSIAGNIDLSVYNITLPPKYIDLSKALDLHEVIVSEYNTEENTSKYYLVTNDLGSDVFDTGTSAYNIYFDLQGTKPIDFVGRGILNFYGDNRGYMPTHPSSIYPKVNFKGDNSVFPGVTVFKDATFEDGITIPAGATVIPQNALDLTNLNVKGHLVI